VVEQHLGNVGHAHGHTGMAGIGLLDGVHGQNTNSVGKSAAIRHLGLYLVVHALQGGSLSAKPACTATGTILIKCALSDRTSSCARAQALLRRAPRRPANSDSGAGVPRQSPASATARCAAARTLALSSS